MENLRLVTVASLIALVGCGGTNTEVVPDGSTSGDGGVTINDDGGVVIDADSGVVINPPSDGGSVEAYCGTALCQCSDGIDNDDPADGLIDRDDPECIAPWDDDESSMGTGLPGDNKNDDCQDCFFDGNTGPGNDGCNIPTVCITEGSNENASGRCKNESCDIAETSQCAMSCRPAVPNGCDCLGCCEVFIDGSPEYIWSASGCSLSDIDNPESGCVSCIQLTTCVNECGDCELCAGKTVDDLPEECGATTTCDDGETPCSADSDCAQYFHCQFGCCVSSVVVI